MSTPAFGRAEAWPALDSVLGDAAREPERTGAVRELCGRVAPGKKLVLVTHNFNIRAVAGVSTSTAELVGRIPTPR